MAKSIELKVAEALQNDVGRGLIRIDSKARKDLDVSTGDIVELKCKRSTAALVWQAHPQDEGLNIIRMDGYLRQNTGVGLGDKITIKKAELKEAKKVVLAPTQPMKYSPGFDQFVKKKMVGRAINRGDTIFIGVFGTSFPLVAAMVQPAGIVMINESTELVLKEAPEKETVQVASITYEDIGGLKEEVQKIREMVELPLRHPELFERLGIEAPKGVLIYGPPGTGKTLLARAVASESEANFVHIGGPELVSKFVGESEERLRQLFKDAEENAPSIIFMDEIDAIAPKREEAQGEVERRMVSQLLTMMDGLKARGQVIVIGATNRPNSIDPALRRPGRFDREVELGVPDRPGRKEILQIHTRSMPLSEDVNLDELASITHGYTGADVSALTKEAAMKVLRRILPKIDLDQEFIPAEILDNLKVTREDFFNALREVRPSALREVFIERPNIRWSDIGGLENVKKELKEAVELPLKSPEVFTKMGIRPVKGILLVGLPGTGKTMFAKAVATETEANFIAIKGPEVLSKWVGESLAYDETVWVADEGGLKRMKIGELVDAHMNENENGSLVQKTAQKQKLLTFTLDENGKSVLAPIEDFIRHRSPESLYHITTRTGREITVTADHALFTLSGGSVGATPANRLIANETHVAMPSRLPSLGQQAVWDLAELFRDNPHVFVKPSPLFKKAIERLGKNSVASLLGLSARYVSENIAGGKNSLSLPAFLKLMDTANVAFDSSGLRLGYFGSSQVLPGRLHATRDLCYVLGFWVAEGDYNTTCLRFSNHNEENRCELSASLARLGIEAKAYDGVIRAEHPLLALFFQKTLALAPYADNKRIPDFLFAAPNLHMAAFLRAYYSGDGSVHGNSHRSYVEASTSSRQLAHDLQHMLLHFGIVATLYRGVEKRNGKEKFKVLFSGVSNFEKFFEIGFSQKSKQERLMAYPSRKAWRRSSQVPLDLGLRIWLVENGFEEWAKSATIGIDRLRQALERHDPQRTFKLAWELVESDYHWDKVISVAKIPYNRQHVYDIGVPGCQRFLAGNGDLLVHNSEKAVRETFRKARMATPCVIFIDEIDSIAPHRGGGDEGNRVTERVVDTLLTEMDGLTGLKNVVVIAATNRPELMDMALMRGGRFDRIIEIPPPDEKTRLEILKIHTKAMPITKAVNLPEIATKTDGYTGADIENVCREAGMAAIRRGVNVDKVEPKDFEESLGTVKPSITKAYVDKIKKFAKGEANTMYR